MKIYEYLAAAALGASFLMAPAMPAMAAAQAADVQGNAGESAEISLPYTYTSKQYGFSIQCPQKPVGVIPASLLYEDKQGDVLIFDNEEYNIKYA